MLTLFYKVDRVAFFQGALEESAASIGEDELRILTARSAYKIDWSSTIHLILYRYIARDDENLAVLKAQKRPGRPSTSQEDQLGHRVDAEEKEFNSGFWIPDIRDEEGARGLRAGSCEWAYLNTRKIARISKEGGIRASTFPPKGLS